MRVESFESVPGSVLAERRCRRGVTQAALGRAMDLSRQRITLIEATAWVPRRTAARFCAALDAIAPEPGVEPTP